MNKPSSRTLEQLTILVKRLEKDRRYMAWVLASYQHQEKLSESKLIEKLQSSRESLLQLALCVYPNPESPEFHDQIKQISSYTKIKDSLIVTIIRQVESLDALSRQVRIDTTDGHVIAMPGIFAAARDSDEAIDADQLSSTDTDDQKNDDEDIDAVG